jgi:hypothetical protein
MAQPPHVTTDPDQSSAAMELRGMFPGITKSNQARECVRIIAGWEAPPTRKNAARK